MSYRQASISKKLFILITICISAIMIVFIILATTILQKYITRQTLKLRLEQISISDNNLITLKETSEDYIKMMMADESLQSLLLRYDMMECGFDKESLLLDLQSTCNSLFTRTSLSRQLLGGALFDSNGVLVFVGTLISNEGIVSQMGNSIQENNSKPEPIWGDKAMTIKAAWSNPEIYNAIPLLKSIRHIENGKYLGHLVLFINEKNIEKANMSAGDSFFVVNKNNSIVSTNDKSLIGQTLNENMQSIMKKSLELGTYILDKDQKVPILYFAETSLSPAWTILYSLPLNQIPQQYSLLWGVAICSLIIVILLMCWCTWVISKQISKPIVQLSETMKNSGELEDFSLRVDAEDYYGEMKILASGFNIFMDTIQQDMVRIHADEEYKRKLELKLLQAQINPHFLYNTLEIIYSLVSLDLNDKALETVQSLSDFYRRSLSKGDSVVTLAEEFRIIEDYLKIQQTRHIEFIEYNIELDEDAGNQLVPKLLIQPLVENSIIHGLGSKQEKMMLLVTGQCDETSENVVIEVTDTGKGITPEKLEELQSSIREGTLNTTDFGISNVASRLRAFFGDGFSMNVTSEKGVATKVRIVLPVVMERDEGNSRL